MMREQKSGKTAPFPGSSKGSDEFACDLVTSALISNGVVGTFQIEEMVYQDAKGVLFQALDKETGQLVAIRRFFLKEDVLAKLKEIVENGELTLFEERLKWLKSLDVPNLQKVLDVASTNWTILPI